MERLQGATDLLVQAGALQAQGQGDAARAALISVGQMVPVNIDTDGAGAPPRDGRVAERKAVTKAESTAPKPVEQPA